VISLTGRFSTTPPTPEGNVYENTAITGKHMEFSFPHLVIEITVNNGLLPYTTLLPSIAKHTWIPAYFKYLSKEHSSTSPSISSLFFRQQGW